jgi:hypothetical protein
MSSVFPPMGSVDADFAPSGRRYEATGTALVAGSISSALVREARALFDSPERTVHVRLAEHAGHIYVDLADEQWRAVEIGPDMASDRIAAGALSPAGRNVADSRARARRIGRSTRLLSQPGKSKRLVLIVSWLLATLRFGGPYPLLAISGEQGAAKTVLSKLLRSLVDPNIAPLRALAREERDLMIAANNGYLLAFDNLSGLPFWVSDALCRLASGGSFAVRQLFTDDEEVLFQAARPILLNGIEDVISRPDLADRAIFLTLPPIAEAQRRPEAELWREFEAARPLIVGALLNAAAHGLRSLAGLDCRPQRTAYR